VDYQNYLLPKLQEACHNKWLDPAKFSDLPTFHKAYVESFARAAAYKEIMFILSNAESEIKRLTESLTGNRNKPYEF
jgi:hypothetical protein